MAAATDSTVVAKADGDDLHVVTDGIIDEVAHTIRAMHRTAGLQFACDVGKLLVEKFYGGDVGKLRRRGPKDASLRELAEHPAMPFGFSALSRAVGIFEVVERLGGVGTCQHLTASHIRFVLGLPDPDQRRLLAAAEEERWPVRKLEDEARRVAPKRRGGRPPLPRFVKTVRAFRGFVDKADDAFGDLEAVAEVHEEEAAALLATLDAMRVHIDELERQLKTRMPGAGTIIDVQPRGPGAEVGTAVSTPPAPAGCDTDVSGPA